MVARRRIGSAFALIVTCVLAAASWRTDAFQTSASRFVLVSAVDKDGEPVVGLTADDVIVQEGGSRCETLNASPAQYPVAILDDTTESARPDFSSLRTAVRRFIDRLSGREIALYTFGERAMRIVDFTRDTD